MTTTAPEFGPVVDDAAGTDNRRKVLAGGVVAALVLGAGGYFFLMGGDSEEAAFSAPVRKRPVVSKPVVKSGAKTVGKTAVKPAVKVPAVSTVKLGRDPFVALYTVPVVAPAAPVKPVTPTAPDSNGTTGTVPYSLTLLSVKSDPGGGRFFTLSVDGVKKTVVYGQKFGKYGELVVLAGLTNSKNVVTGAMLQVGDDDPVNVKLGDKITVL